MVETLVLDLWDKLAIVALALLLMFLVLLCVICIVTPLCPLNSYCPCKETDDLRKPLQTYGAVEYGSDLELKNAKALHTSQDGSLGYWSQIGVHRDQSETSDGFVSDTLSERIDLKKNSRPKRNSSRASDSSGSSIVAPYLHRNVTLSFTLSLDKSHNKLNIKVKQLSGFRVSDPDGAMAPYIKVRVYRVPKQFFSFRSKAGREQLLNNLDLEMQTKIQRRTDDPVFNETFVVDLDQKDWTTLSLRLLVCDFDRYQRHVVVGEVITELGSLEWPPENEVDFCEQLLPPTEENLGELHVGLMYLPTSEKLNLFLIAAHGLKVVDQHKQSAECYVKLTLMYDGRAMKRVKTAMQSNDVSPIFNETFTFDVPNAQLEKVYFILSVLHLDKEGKRHLVGRCYIGKNFDSDAREQWEELMQSPRKQVTSWHRVQS